MFSIDSIKIIFVSVSFCFSIFLPLSHIHADVFEVGPSKKFVRISQVPFDSLNPGDVVRIYYRDKPYQEKFIIRRSGTEQAPIIIAGVSKKGKLPVIDGASSIQFQKDLSRQSGRWLVKVGDNSPGDYVEIKNLHLRNANNSQKYLLDKVVYNYNDNASGVFICRGRHVTISGCIISSCGNGVQTSYAPRVAGVTLNKCLIFGNGNHQNLDSSQEHNVYLCGTETKVQFCRFGEPFSNGNNIKDRGLDTVIRYNWIEGGKNRQIDLVDYKEYKKADAYVYGNVIIQGKITNNRNMIHWGGDAGHSRAGTLYFFNNTVIGKSEQAKFFVTRRSNCDLSLTNNVFVGAGVLWNKKGGLKGSNNWFSSKISVPYDRKLGTAGVNPGFFAKYGIPFLPLTGSALVDHGTEKIPFEVKYMPKPSGGGINRPKTGNIDIGAFESGSHWYKKN